jgi:hypothetical protein
MKALIKKTLPLLSLCLIAACSGSSGGGSSRQNEVAEETTTTSGINQNEVVTPDGANIDGLYAADLWPVNYNLHLKSVGAVGVSRTGDTFEAIVNMKYAPRSVVLKSATYTARRCPNLNDDLNKDAYIDINEARVAIGKITIPFDSDLDSQAGGSFGVSGADGKYFYQKTASFERLFADLKLPDENPMDQYIKLGQEDGLTFPGRIVIVQGLADTVTLPETVGTADGESSHQTIPVACGVLWKVAEMPEGLRL